MRTLQLRPRTLPALTPIVTETDKYPACATCGHPMYCTESCCVNVVDGMAHHDGCKADTDDPESVLRTAMLRGEISRELYHEEIEWLRRVDRETERILSLSQEELDAELISLGIDPAESVERVRRSIELALLARDSARTD